MKSVATGEKLCNNVETVKGFYYLRDRLISCGGSESALMARTRIGSIRFTESREVLYDKHFSLQLNR